MNSIHIKLMTMNKMNVIHMLKCSINFFKIGNIIVWYVKSLGRHRWLCQAICT